MNTYEVTLTLEVTANSIEEAKKYFIDDIKELNYQLKPDVKITESNVSEEFKTLEEIQSFLTGNSHETIVNYVMSQNDLDFEEMVAWSKTNGLHKLISESERRKLILQVLKDIPLEVVAEKGFAAYLLK